MASAAHPPSRRYGFRPGWHAVRIKHQNRPGFGVISRCSPRSAHGESTKARKRKQFKKGKGSAGSFERQAETVGSVVSGPGEIWLCRGEDRAEDPDDAADLAGPTTEVDQDDADYTGHDGAVHQVLPRDRRGGPECRSEDDVQDYRRRHRSILALRNAGRSHPLDPIRREGQEDRQEATQHQQQLMWLLRAELGHGLSSALVAVGHGFSPDGGAGSIRVPLQPSARENQFAGVAENHSAKQGSRVQYRRTPRSSHAAALPRRDHDDLSGGGPDAHEARRDRGAVPHRPRPLRPIQLLASGDRPADGGWQGEARALRRVWEDRGVLRHPDEVRTRLADPRCRERGAQNLGRYAVGWPVTSTQTPAHPDGRSPTFSRTAASSANAFRSRAASSNAACSSSARGHSSRPRTRPVPRTAGTPIATSWTPYAPSRTTEQGTTRGREPMRAWMSSTVAPPGPNAA